MKLTVESNIAPIEVLGMLEPYELHPARRVLIDGKRMPPGLERIILAGLDQLTGDYLNEIEREIKAVGWRLK